MREGRNVRAQAISWNLWLKLDRSAMPAMLF